MPGCGARGQGAVQEPQRVVPEALPRPPNAAPASLLRAPGGLPTHAPSAAARIVACQEQAVGLGGEEGDEDAEATIVVGVDPPHALPQLSQQIGIHGR